MTIDYSKRGKVKFSMGDYVENIIAETPEDLLQGSSATPAASHLFQVNPSCTKLDSERTVLFHHLTARLLYLCKRARPDIHTAVAFLTTRVQSPDEDDYKKLGRCLKYLKETKDDALTLEADSMSVIRWWVDASFAVHPDYKSHTGATMTLGKGHPVNMSIKQKINTRSSTEAELVGVNDALALVLWVRSFIIGQGFTVTDNIIYQDNQSAMLLERNGMRSSGKKTRHIEIRYYFITDNIRRGTASVEYCPTEDMYADFFTKPIQGSLFRKFKKGIMNIPDVTPTHSGVSDMQECAGTSTRVRMEGQTEHDDDDDGHEHVPNQARVSWSDVVKRGSSADVDRRSSRFNGAAQTRLTCLSKAL
jgi:hypothetical protein